jgi:hypothetical protein
MDKVTMVEAKWLASRICNDRRMVGIAIVSKNEFEFFFS